MDEGIVAICINAGIIAFGAGVTVSCVRNLRASFDELREDFKGLEKKVTNGITTRQIEQGERLAHVESAVDSHGRTIGWLDDRIKEHERHAPQSPGRRSAGS